MMHARKAHEKLFDLASAPASIETYTKAAVLIDGLLRNNANPDDGRPNGTVKSKLKSARGWFEILCEIGEDGGWPEEQLRQFIRNELSEAASQIEPDGLNYESWPAVADRAEL